MSNGELRLVRPRGQGSGEDMGGDYQDRAYRKAWEEFRPDKYEGAEGGQEEEKDEGSAGDEDEAGHCSRVVATPEAPSAREWEDYKVSSEIGVNIVRGRAKAGSYKRVNRESELPIVGIDCMWITSEGEEGEERQHR